MLITDLQMASTKIDRDGFQVEMMQERSLSMWPQMIRKLNLSPVTDVVVMPGNIYAEWDKARVKNAMANVIWATKKNNTNVKIVVMGILPRPDKELQLETSLIHINLDLGIFCKSQC